MESERSRLLLVDSDKEVLLTVSAVLRRYLDVHVASTMEQANAVVRDLSFHALLIGDTLLRSDGAALIGLVRQAVPWAQVMVLCKNDPSEIPADIVAKGIGDVLTKPFDAGALRPRVDRLLEAMREQRAQLEIERERATRMRHIDRVSLLGTLVATVGHEVANPLEIALGNAMLAAEIVDDDNASDDDKAYLPIALHETIDAIRTIQEYLVRILSFSRKSEASESENLTDTLRTALRFARPRAAEKGVRLHFLPGDVPNVRHDSVSFTQAVVNGLTNAIDAVDKEGNVWLRIEESVEDLTVIVEDDGPGINQLEIEASLAAFSTTKPTGTGLGTSVMQQVMLEHAGRVLFANREGHRGFCVRLLLPRRMPAKTFAGRSSSCPGSDCR